MISVNENAMPMVKDLIKRAASLGCEYKKLKNGAHVVDMGINVPGGWEAARIFTEINMACLGTCNYHDYQLSETYSVPAVEVYCDNPLLGCLASQIAGYPLGSGDFAAIGSGPARAQAALKEDHCFEYTDYRDHHHEVVIGVQANELPDEAMAEKVAADCKVKPENVYLLAHNTTCIVASVQVSARIMEQTINKMIAKGFDLNTIQFSRGLCVVAPVVFDDDDAMGKINDCLLYGGKSEFWVRWEDEKIEKILPQLVTEHSKDYGTLFKKLFLAAERDFYKMDLDIHSPAEVTIYNMNTGNVFHAGKIRKDLMIKSLFNNCNQ
ncbi:methenyltetrahydromethanopterin cyclohydrolase [Clostridia bacterium]|nr:methenyltetrahydromethanopterin cyclohydrolase [Clostridia bacterium]